jgi:Zn-finger nucleic acid-binding protein
MYRDNHRICPKCTSTLNQRGSVDQCPECSGTLVAASILEEMVQGMSGASSEISLQWEAATESSETRACPGCEKAMAPVLFASVTVDLCDEHGFWFDPEELQAALRQIGQDKPAAKSVSFWTAIVGWLMSPRNSSMGLGDFRSLFHDGHVDHAGWSPRLPDED